MQKTLGGDRLGSGNKMKVHLHGYERSQHDLGKIWRSTMSAGTLVPFIKEIGLPGDTHDIELDCDVKTHPTIGPLFGSYKIQLDVFMAPLRLYHGALHNNAINIGRNMSQIKLPLIELTANDLDDVPLTEIDTAQINPSSLLAYMGIRGVGAVTGSNQTREFNAIPILAYWEIYKNYYANKQEEVGAVIHTPNPVIVTTVDEINVSNSGVDTLVPFAPATGSASLINGSQIIVDYTGAAPIPEQIIFVTQNHGTKNLQELSSITVIVTGTQLIAPYNYNLYGNETLSQWRYIVNTDVSNNKPIVEFFPLANIDEVRNLILANAANPAPLVIPGDINQEPYVWLAQSSNSIPNALNSQEGLALKTYQSDLLNNWLSTDWIDGVGGITEVTSIDTSGGSFSLDTLNLSRKVYNMLNRIAVSGGSYYDWLDAVYDHERYDRCESPMYMGSLIKELAFQEVVSNSEANTDGGAQPLGTLAGKGIMTKKHKGGKIIVKVDEPCYIIGLISLTPRIDNSQGNKWDVHLKTMDDLHKPALDEIGFQELITEQMTWWSTEWNGTAWIQKSAGKQPAWLNYMTNINETYGNFAIPTNEMFMTLNRRYEADAPGEILDLTTYIDPSKFNFIFANTAIDAQNFWVQIAVDHIARRKMSAKLMPNL